MPSQKSVEPRRSRRLSEQKQQRQIDKGFPESRHAHIWISPIVGPPLEQDGTLNSVQPTNQVRNKASGARSPNAFILFRSDFWAREKLKVEPIERDHRDISRIAAICWNNLDEETKAVYRKRAEEHRTLHRLQHSEYKYSTIQDSARKGKRRTRQSGSIDEERCKQLAIQVMAEFQRGRKTQNGAGRRVRDSDHGPCPDPCENMTETTVEEMKVRETAITVWDHSLMATSGNERKEAWMNIEDMIANAVDTQFDYKPRLERYIPKLQFWYAIKSHRDENADRLLDSQNDLGPTDGWDRAGGHQLLSTREDVADLDCEVELDRYFQFDKCEEPQ